MNKLVALPIVDAVPMVPVDDKTIRIAAEVIEAEKRVRSHGVPRDLLERNGLSKSGYAALCRLETLAGKLTRTRPSTIAGLVAKAHIAELVEGYSEGYSAEIQKELASDVLGLLASGTPTRILADLAARENSRGKASMVQAVSDHRLAIRAEAKARLVLNKLVKKYPELEDVRPAVAAGIRAGKPIVVRCRADWRAFYGDRHDAEWPKFERALDEARPAHSLARRRVGITKAQNAAYEAGRVVARAFERVCRMKPQSPGDLKAFAGVIVGHLQREAEGSISNVYPYSGDCDYHAWKDRRHSAMFTALRVLNHLAR